MLESKDIENILNQVLRTIGNEDSENSKPVMIFGDVNITIHCDSLDDSDIPPSNHQVTYNYNYDYSDKSDGRSDEEEKAWRRFYGANSIL